MAVNTLLKESFNAGEFGDRMHARVQFDKYANAGAIYQNILPLPQGGWTSRSGWRYINDAHTASVRSWLVPFVYSTTQAYMLELGATVMRFFRNQALIAANDVAASITNGTFDSDVTTGWTDNSNGTGAQSHDAANDRCNLDGAGSGNESIITQAITITETTTEHVVRFQIEGDPGDEVTVRVGTATGGASQDLLADQKKKVGWHTIEFDPDSNATVYLSFENAQSKTIQLDNVEIIDNAAVSITTPWAEADLPDISFAQSADVIYFAIGGGTRVYRLERIDNSSWSLIKVLFEDGPWLAENTTSTTLDPGATSGNGVTLVASAVTGINNDVGFRATDVGRLVRYKDTGNKWYWFQIVGFTNTTTVTIDIPAGQSMSAHTAVTTWRLGKWNDTDGWPAVVGFIQQRLGFANSTTYPQSFWLSKSADIENFADEDIDGNVQDDSAIDYRFAALQVNTIRWLAMRKKPVIGTQGGEWTLRSDGAVLTPTDIAADFEVTGGVARVQPLEVRSRLLFAQTQARKLVEFADVLQADGVQGFDSFDLTLLNDRVLGTGVTQLAYAQEPDSVIWTVRNDGQAPTLTYQPEQNVVGWARQIHGGSFQGGDAVIESIAAIPGQNGSGQFKDSSGRSEVWAVVKMEVNGSTVRFIECMEKQYRADEDLQEDAFYVDSGLTLSNPKTISGITSADPAVVTATAHGISDSTEVRIVRVKGMTEINGNSYILAESATNSFELSALDGVSITAITKANPGQVTAPDHGMATNDEVHFHNVGGMTEVNGNGYTITKVDDDNVTIGVDTSAFTTYTSGGTMNAAVDTSDTDDFTAYSADGEVRAKQSTVTGLDHLEGETVQVYADGFVQDDKTVSSGSITLDDAASVVHVGKQYERRWKSLKLAFGANEGTAVAKPKTIADLGVVLMETGAGALSFATEDVDGENAFTQLVTRDAGQINDDPTPFFTGEKKLGVAAGYDTDLRLVIKGTAPLPSTVLGLVPELDTSG